MVQPWVQPLLNANGTFGGSEFAVAGAGYSSLPAYYAFDGNSSTYARVYYSNYTSPMSYLAIYNPSPLRITGLHLVQDTGSYLYTGEIYVSNNGGDWTKLCDITGNTAVQDFDLSANTGFYNYYKFVPLTTRTSPAWYLSEFTITATHIPLVYPNAWAAPSENKWIIKY